ncbi:MAG: ABC transporter substrate-binding protein, partial [Hyphomicrobiales bacterium]
MQRCFRAIIIALGLFASLSAALAANTNLNMGMVLEPPHLDPPAGAAAAIDEVVYANVFEGLTRIDETGAVKPALAKSWTVSADGLTYTFALQTGVKFHDGTDMNADDVVFTLNRIIAKDSTNAQKALFKAIAKVEAKDAST